MREDEFTEEERELLEALGVRAADLGVLLISFRRWVPRPEWTARIRRAAEKRGLA